MFAKSCRIALRERARAHLVISFAVCSSCTQTPNGREAANGVTHFAELFDRLYDNEAVAFITRCINIQNIANLQLLLVTPDYYRLFRRRFY